MGYSGNVMRLGYGLAAGVAGMIIGLVPTAGSAASLTLPARPGGHGAAGPAGAIPAAGRPGARFVTGVKAGAALYGGAVDSSPITVSPDGSKVFASGTQLLAYNPATGAKVWTSTASVRPIVVSSDGSTIFGGGAVLDASGSEQYATYAFNANTGAQKWLATYHGPGVGNDQISSIAVSPDGSQVFVTGASEGPNHIYEFATIAYQAATGSVSWVARYAVANRTAGATSVAVSPDGSTVYVAGTVHPGGQDYGVVAYNAATGGQVWASTALGTGALQSMTLSPDGTKVFVTGQSKGKSGVFGYTTVAFDAATGTRLWLRRLDRWLLGLPFNMMVSPDGMKVFVTGYAQVKDAPTSPEKFATVAYGAATGAQLWTRLYGPPGKQSQGMGVAVSPDGLAAFVTGFTVIQPSFPTAIVAYNAATGSTLWAAHGG